MHAPPTMRITRRADFPAAHSYSRGPVPEAEAEKLFGRAARGAGHGHNYRLELTLEGPVDRTTRMVANLSDMKRLIRERVLADYDHAFIDREIDYFQSRLPTLENMVRHMWGALAAGIETVLPAGPGATRPVPVRLRLAEDETLWVVYEGGAEVDLTRVIDFSASHRLYVSSLSAAENEALFGKCNYPHGHGHNYVCEFTARGRPDERTGIAVDLVRFDRILDEEVMERFDHRHLNHDIPELADANPTTGALTKLIFDRVADRCRREGIRLVRVKVWETARNAFEYEAPEDA